MFFISLVLCCAFSFADTTESLKNRIGKLVKRSGLQTRDLGIHIGISKDGERSQVYSLNSEKLMIPASLTKIVTAGVALQKLSPTAKFKTQILGAAPVRKGVLEGPLYLRGFGDSGFVSEDMWVLTNDLLRSGVQVIKGGIVVDDSYFDRVRQDPTRDGSNVDRAYAAPIGAMSFNWNSVNVYIRPGDKLGAKARVIIDPDNDYIRLINETKTIRSGRASNFQVKRLAGREGFHGDLIKVAGSVSQSVQEEVEYKSITRPDIWSGYNLKAFLERRGVEIEGGVRTGSVPNSAVVLAENESKPLALLIRDMMKFSNNYVAEMLTKQLAANSGQTPASMERGVSIIQSQLSSWGLSSGIRIVNPSGLTRKNKMRAKSLYELLNQFIESFDMFPENLASYPVAGRDGTLKRRMKNSVAAGWVRAKTGLLSGASGLAGYAGRKDGGLVTFVFLFNGPTSKTYASRKFFDDLATELVK